MVEALKKTQEEYLQLHFIPYMQSDTIAVFEKSLHRSNAMVQISHQLLYINLIIVKGPKSSYMSVLVDTGAGLNLVSLEYHQSVPERHPNFVMKFA